MATYNLDEYLQPIWETEEVYNETFMFLGEEDEAPFCMRPRKLSTSKIISSIRNI